MDMNYEKNFIFSLRAMRINRSDPAIKRDLKWLAQFIVMHGVFTVIFLLVIYNIIFVNLKENDFSQTCKNSILALVYIVITFHYITLLWKQKHFRMIIDKIERDYIIAKSLNMAEQKIIHRYAMMGKHVSKQWLIIALAGTGSFLVKNVALVMFYWIIDGEFYFIPVYDLVYPSFIEERKDKLAIFAINYLLFLYYGLYSSVMYCAIVPLGPIFMLHACGQLEVVKCRIDVLFDTDDLEEVRQNLKNIIKQLQYIYDLVDRINSCFKESYELTLKITTIILPITCYEVIESLKHGELSLEFINFIVGGILSSSSPCFYSDLLVEKGEDVRLAMYSCGWERVYDRGIRSTVLIVLQRALRPVAVSTLFRTVCLDALTDVFQQAYTLFNLMNAAWN